MVRSRSDPLKRIDTRIRYTGHNLEINTQGGHRLYNGVGASFEYLPILIIDQYLIRNKYQLMNPSLAILISFLLLALPITVSGQLYFPSRVFSARTSSSPRPDDNHQHSYSRGRHDQLSRRVPLHLNSWRRIR